MDTKKKDIPSSNEPLLDPASISEEPPTYSDIFGVVDDSVRLQDDGRVAVNLNSRLYHVLTRIKRKPLNDTAIETPAPVYTERGHDSIRLNIVIQVVGSRGDVQPFVALGCELLKHGHRVRLATHPVFQDFVLKAGLEFFSIGGDPTELMAYMVKNPGLLPNMKSLRAGDVQGKQRMVAKMLRGCWSSCISPDPISGQPFVAEAIIANPPSFAHIHCAQALGVPAHLMFTMPWTSTVEFSHPLATFINNKQKRATTREAANYMSYLAVEWLTWQGLGDVINTWRESIGLEEITFTEGLLLAETLKVPVTYCWSPSLVPKPMDWGEHIDVCGFFFRSIPRYDPEPELDTFLRNGDRPVYIGFGSIVIDDPAKLTSVILESVKAAGVRAIISKGWSELGANCDTDPDVLFLGDCPHEWLFQHVSALVHHGGAGTTACGLLNGKPMTIVPFFGDQPFWGDMVAAAGAGPAPIPYKELDVRNLTDALRFCLTEEASAASKGIAEQMKHESGVRRAVANFHANLPLATMRCEILPDRPAAWLLKRRGREVKLSKDIAGLLIRHRRVNWKDLDRYDTKDTFIELRRLEPVTGTLSSLVTVGTGMAGSAIDIVAKPIQAYNQAKTISEDNTATPTKDQPQEVPQHPSADVGNKTKKEASYFKTAVAGSAAGFGGVLKHFSKGMLDAPLAVAEGFRNAPRLYGGDVYQPGRIDGVLSGGTVAGKNMYHGIVEGFGGLVMSPVRGAKSGGPIGFIKGAGIGCLNMSTKVPSGLVGLIFYPGQGLYKTIYTVTHRKTREELKRARQAESEQLAAQQSEDSKRVLQHFETLLQQPPESGNTIVQHFSSWRKQRGS